MTFKVPTNRGAVAFCLAACQLAQLTQAAHVAAQDAAVVQPAAPPAAAAPAPAARAETTTPAASVEANPGGAETPAADAQADRGWDQLPEGTVMVDAELSHLLAVRPRAEGGRTADEIAEWAVRESAEVARAKAESERAAEQADDAYSLFLPRVELKASYTRLSPVEVVPFSFPGAPASSASDCLTGACFLDRYSLQASVRIPVSEYFLTLKDHYDSAQHLEVVGQLQREGQTQAIIHNAKQMYYELARAEAAHKLAEMRLTQLTEFTREIEALVTAGSLSSVELAQAKARQASAQASLTQALAAQHIAEMTLRANLAADGAEVLAIGEPLLDNRPPPPGDFEPLVKQALLHRPEALALTTLISAQSQTREAIAGSRYPTLSLFGNINYDNPNQRLFPVEERFYATWAVGAELAWSPTALATQNSQLKDAELDIKRTQQDLRSLQARIVIEVSSAYEQAMSAEAAITASEEALKAAREALDARVALFRVGEATTRQWMDAEIELRTAQLAYIDNILTTHMARAALDHVTAATAAAKK